MFSAVKSELIDASVRWYHAEQLAADPDAQLTPKRQLKVMYITDPTGALYEKDGFIGLRYSGISASARTAATLDLATDIIDGDDQTAGDVV